MRRFLRAMPRSVRMLLAGLLVIWSPVWAQQMPGRESGETWRATDPPEWQSGASLTDPYPPEDLPLSSDELDTLPEPRAEKKSLTPIAATGQNAGTSTADPVIQRLDEAYEDIAGEGGLRSNRNTVVSSMGNALLRALFALTLVLGLFFLFVRVLKWIRSFTPASVAALGGPSRIAVTDRVPLGARHAVYLLKIRDRIIVAGTAPGTIVPLAILPADDAGQQPCSEKDRELGSSGASEAGERGTPAQFRGLLLKTLERIKAQAAEAAGETEAGAETAVRDPVDRDIDALREDIERLRRFLEESGRDRGGE